MMKGASRIVVEAKNFIPVKYGNNHFVVAVQSDVRRFDQNTQVTTTYVVSEKGGSSVGAALQNVSERLQYVRERCQEHRRQD